MDWLRDVRYGMSNLIRFFSIVWRWRAWDSEYSYRLFLFGLGQSAIVFGKCQNHETWLQDVKSINRLLELWKLYGEAEPEAEEALWEDFHAHLNEDARTWWN